MNTNALVQSSDSRHGVGPVWRLVIVAGSWLVVLLSAVGQWVLLGLADPQGELAHEVIPGDISGPLFFLVLAGFGGMVVLRGDTPRYGWLMLATGFLLGVIGFTGAYSLFALEASVPFGEAAAWVQDQWLVTWLLALLLLPALFPDGRVASSRWKLPVRLATTVWVLFIVTFTFTERQISNWLLNVNDPLPNATGVLPIPEITYNGTWVVISLVSIVIGIGSLITRWRRAGFELRQQVKWVLFAFGLFLAIVALDVANQVLEVNRISLGLFWPLEFLLAVAMVGFVVALGLAVLRYRLYHVDLVINRTIVYGVLTVLVVALYVAVVVGVGALLPVEQTFLALLVIGLVAVAFAPLRDRLQGSVNRMMFGQRDDPYAVLSEMGRLMAETGSPEGTLQTLTEIVATSLKLPGSAVELEQDGEWTVRASFGNAVTADWGRIVVPLRHQGEVVGRLVVEPRSAREPLSSQDLALLEDIAHPAGAIARSVRLTAALQSSRERLVLAREEERRRLRRDLHDGLGPTLASQTFQLDEILERLYHDPAGTADLVVALKEQNQQLVADVRRLVYELRPPALDELGIAGALTAHVAQYERSSPVTIEVETSPDPLPALPAAVEVAAYRIAREAITNTLRHAKAGHCQASLRVSDADLTIEVRDDGVGVSSGVRAGVGISSMRERTEELGGEFSIGPAEHAGTRVRATLPLANGRVAGGVA
ncbi:MAG TPA: ATP-binding protein [Acidimicrobiia bacterium]|nr:ATP-binding protein [Acidimicrobiia bacterium]